MNKPSIYSYLPLQWGKGSNARKGFLVLLGSSLAFSLMTVCAKHLGGRLPVAEIVLSRALISLLITRLMLKQAGVSPWGNNKRMLWIRGLLGTLALFCVFKALEELPLASATVLQYTYPTFAAIGAWIFLKERTSSQIWIAVILGWLGIWMVVNPTWPNSSVSGLSTIQTLIALTGAFLTALAYVCVRNLSKHEHPLVIVYYFPLVSVPITFPLVWNGGVMPIGMEWIWLLGIGLLTQIGQVLITEGLRILPAAIASSINYVQVLFATLWGLILFSEPIEAPTILGSILILCATLISVSSKKVVKA